MSKTIYQQAVDAGLEIANHESDLYIKDSHEARVLVGNYEFPTNCHPFRNQIDGSIWWEVPFAFDPWWKERSRL